jgi:hypothetical protein
MFPVHMCWEPETAYYRQHITEEGHKLGRPVEKFATVTILYVHVTLVKIPCLLLGMQFEEKNIFEFTIAAVVEKWVAITKEFGLAKLGRGIAPMVLRQNVASHNIYVT